MDNRCAEARDPFVTNIQFIASYQLLIKTQIILLWNWRAYTLRRKAHSAPCIRCSVLFEVAQSGQPSKLCFGVQICPPCGGVIGVQFSARRRDGTAGKADAFDRVDRRQKSSAFAKRGDNRTGYRSPRRRTSSPPGLRPIARLGDLAPWRFLYPDMPLGAPCDRDGFLQACIEDKCL